MKDWFLSVASALGDPGAWRLFRRIFTYALVDEGWHFAIIALAMWMLLHVLLKRWLSHRVIAAWPTAADIRREIAYSASTVVVFAGLNVVLMGMFLSKHAEIYSRPMAHGLVWLMLSLPALLLWQDFYFYWTHRLLHTRWLFQHVHGVHHRSRNPSPWAAYAFHPAEALNNSIMLLIALAIVPVHEAVLAIFVFHQIIRNTHGHAAVETMPKGFARHPIWGRFTTTTHHHLHHETARGNYGLWFTWWDRVCGTERPEYLARFEATAPSRPAKEEPTLTSAIDHQKAAHLSKPDSPSDSMAVAATGRKK